MIKKDQMIFRDDDIGYLTNIEEFDKVHQLFNQYKCVHTLAMITKNLWQHKELVEYLNEQYKRNAVDCQVHGYQHADFALSTSQEIRYQLRESKKILIDLFGKVPTVFYPPFNSINEKVIEIANEEGLEVSINKVSCLYYIKHNGEVIDKIINFHFWDYGEAILIDTCLKIYKEKTKTLKPTRI